MLDIEIVNFYNSVRDPSWPDIQNYVDWVSLPEHIKEECNDLHGFQHRKEQVCDAEYWRSITTDVCVYKNLAYVPIPKCAYMYNTTLFTNLGWTKVPISELDMDAINFFGPIMHPLNRWFKGITEWLVQAYAVNEPILTPSNPWANNAMQIDWAQLTADLKNKYFKKLISTVNIGDLHSLPYSAMFGSMLDKINWIPMDVLTDNQVKISMMNFFKLHGHNIALPLDDQRLHVSNSTQLEILNTVKQEFYTNKSQIYSFYKLYADDLKFYYNLVDKFTPDWQLL